MGREQYVKCFPPKNKVFQIRANKGKTSGSIDDFRQWSMVGKSKDKVAW